MTLSGPYAWGATMSPGIRPEPWHAAPATTVWSTLPSPAHTTNSPGIRPRRRHAADSLGLSTVAFHEIPIVDVSELRRPGGPSAEFCTEFTDICHNVGFALWSPTTASLHRADCRCVRDDAPVLRPACLPTSSESIRHESPQFRGWEPVGAETTNNAADMREQIDVWTEWPTTSAIDPVYSRLLGPNQWLPDSCPRSTPRPLAALDRRARRSSPTNSWRRSSGRPRPGTEATSATCSATSQCRWPSSSTTRPRPPGGAGVNPHHDAGFLHRARAWPHSGPAGPEPRRRLDRRADRS